MRVMLRSVPTILSLLTLLAFGSVPLRAQTTTTTSLTVSPSTVSDGQHGVLSATVTPASGAAPSGTVGFYSGSKLFATVELNDEGTASLKLSAATIAPGTYSIRAKYSGSSTDAASTSSPVSATVLADSSTALSSATSSYVLGQPATLTASVTGELKKTPTGSIGFYYGKILLGSSTLKSGSASITRTIPVSYEAGSYEITAKYSGDETFASSFGSFTLSLNFAISPDGAAIPAATTTDFALSPVPSAATTWYVNGIAGGNSSVGTISSAGLYTAPATSSALTLEITASVATSPHYTSSAVPLYVMPPGVVSATPNGQVASYTINLPAGATVSAQFGTTTSYGLDTWSLPAPSGGGSTQLLIAGMMATTLYHIQGLVRLPGGLAFTDADNEFTTTKSLPTYYDPTVTVTTNPDFTPEPGVEFLDQLSRSASIFDLAGNFLWGYTGAESGTSVDRFHPFKLLPNGHLLIAESPENNYPLNGTLPPNTIIEAIEVDYANTIIRKLDLPTLQTALDGFGYVNDLGQPITLLDIHHDVTVNPVTGHWILITNTSEFFSSLPGYPKGVTVLGDVIIDVDPNNNFAVDWVWNEFDHLDVNRQPMGFPDWTHTNAVIYSADDHNILVSIRHQNWVVKINYNDGAGDGTLIWHLGYQGEFTLVGGAGTHDWQYAQHGPSFTTANTTGVFGLALMDNGNDRVFPTGFTCPVALNDGVCLYSRAPIFTIDENAMTATLSNGQRGPAYSSWGGNAEQLGNGNLEADYTASDAGTSRIEEYTQGSNSQIVWQMKTSEPQYRAFRRSSPYPGVTWSAEALSFQAEHATHPAKK
jgi:arylsulfate sulfotransferase